MNLPVIVVGSGGHAKVLISALRASGREILGITDPDAAPGTRVLGVNVVGGDDVIQNYAPDEVQLANGIGSMPGSRLRTQVAARLREACYHFATVVHPSAIVGDGVALAEGVQVMAGCVLQPDVTIGVDSIVNTGAIVDHDSVVGMRCHIAPGVTLSGTVSLGDDVHVGTGSIVIQGINISAGCIVGAGSIVLSDLAPGTKFIQPRSVRAEPIEE